MELSIWNVAMTAMLALAALPAGAQDVHGDHNEHEEYHADYIYGRPADPTEAWILARGGKLYDNWFVTLDTEEPKETHPAWPASNTNHDGATTHRCKSCHGWDYLGAHGQYGTGSYNTGIRGITLYAGSALTEIVAVLRDENHGFSSEMLPDIEAEYLAQFISGGMDEMISVIDPNTGEVAGDTRYGQAIYQTICASCHGYDGRARDWGDADEPGYVGTEANANPWEVLHKIRNGHPGHEMVALRAFSLQDAADVLSFAQTLPVE
jgi:cytochrome c553